MGCSCTISYGIFPDKFWYFVRTCTNVVRTMEKRSISIVCAPFSSREISRERLRNHCVTSDFVLVSERAPLWSNKYNLSRIRTHYLNSPSFSANDKPRLPPARIADARMNHRRAPFLKRLRELTLYYYVAWVDNFSLALRWEETHRKRERD